MGTRVLFISIHTLARRVTIRLDLLHWCSHHFNPHSRTESDVHPISPYPTRKKTTKSANLIFSLLENIPKYNKKPRSPYRARGANLLGFSCELGVRTDVPPTLPSSSLHFTIHQNNTGSVSSPRQPSNPSKYCLLSRPPPYPTSCPFIPITR